MRALRRRAFSQLVAGLFGSALAFPGVAAVPVAAGVLMHPTLTDYAQINSSTTPPNEAQCELVGRRCFTPQAIQSAYHVSPLYTANINGAGTTIAIVDSFGSDTIAHDLHVFDTAFGLQPMCGEENVTCGSGMPTFSQFHYGGAVPTNPIPGHNTTGLQDHSAWAIEVSLDVETAHAMAPMANILLVTTPTAETLGLQGFPDMVNAEQYVIDHHMANVISQSFASAEDAFGSFQSLLNLRHAYISAAQNGVTVLGSSGDNGVANVSKQPWKVQPVIPFPTVVWPASDPLVTGVGGTYLCTDPTAQTNDPRTIYAGPPGKCLANPTQSEVGWTFSGGGFSHVFSKPSYQNTLPSGSTAIGSMRGVPDIGLMASAGSGALIYVSLPPAGTSGLICDTGNPCSTGWYDIGGTSLSCPQWAALVAMADQKAGHGLGLINPTLYSLASGSSYSNDFYDVTVGNNTQVFSNGT
ncbi:MAG TPA: S53 family peptidase, partial [Candidatus Udaeobacter sp.]|nr:S53 family peptidase [Candidatus Udaeobacter sp.]